MSHYHLLGVSCDASQAEIHRAFKKKALILHPDRNLPDQKDESTNQFQLLAEAYQVLKDPVKRQRYDSNHLNSQAPHRPQPQKASSARFDSSDWLPRTNSCPSYPYSSSGTRPRANSSSYSKPTPFTSAPKPAQASPTASRASTSASSQQPAYASCSGTKPSAYTKSPKSFLRPNNPVPAFYPIPKRHNQTGTEQPLPQETRTAPSQAHSKVQDWRHDLFQSRKTQPTSQPTHLYRSHSTQNASHPSPIRPRSGFFAGRGGPLDEYAVFESVCDDGISHWFDQLLNQKPTDIKATADPRGPVRSSSLHENNPNYTRNRTRMAATDEIKRRGRSSAPVTSEGPVPRHRSSSVRSGHGFRTESPFSFESKDDMSRRSERAHGIDYESIYSPNSSSYSTRSPTWLSAHCPVTPAINPSSRRSDDNSTKNPSQLSGEGQPSHRNRSNSMSYPDPVDSSSSKYKSYHQEYIIRIRKENDGSSKVEQQIRSRWVGCDGSVIDKYRRRRSGVIH